MSITTDKYIKKTEPNYKLIIAGKEHVISSVTLTQFPGTTDWSISANESKRVSYFVANEICKNINSPLLYPELEFLRNLFLIKQSEVAIKLGLDESTVSKWRRKEEGNLEIGASQLLKRFFMNKLVKYFTAKGQITTDEIKISINELHRVEEICGELITSAITLVENATTQNIKVLNIETHEQDCIKIYQDVNTEEIATIYSY